MYTKTCAQNDVPPQDWMKSCPQIYLFGHGTHTSSIAAGCRVHGVSALGGFAQGTALGAMPHMRVAMYKVCWSVPMKDKYLSFSCWPEDMLAAIDDAIADGVNVLSISIGSSISIRSMLPFDYKDDAIAIGALHATKKNIVVSCSAGNDGPHPGTLSNMAPWIITVGASSIDRGVSPYIDIEKLIEPVLQ